MLPFCSCVPSDQVDTFASCVHFWRGEKSYRGHKYAGMFHYVGPKCNASVSLPTGDICTLGQVLWAFVQCARSRLRNNSNKTTSALSDDHQVFLIVVPSDCSLSLNPLLLIICSNRQLAKSEAKADLSPNRETARGPSTGSELVPKKW